MGNLLSMSGANVDNCACDIKTTPGTTAKLYWVPECEVTDFPPTLEESGNGDGTMSDCVTLDGDIITDQVTPGCGYFREYDIILDSGLVQDDAVGERGSKSFDNMITFKLAGNDAEQLGFAAKVLNCPAILVIKQKTGVYRTIGTKDLPAYIESIAITSGDAPGSANNGTYSVKTNTCTPAYIYEGILDTTPNP